MLPLYAQIPKDSFDKATTAHTGLLFDKFPDAWNESQHYQLADNAKKDFLTNCIKKYTQTELAKNLTIALNRQRDLVKHHLHGESLTVTTNWRFITGLGTAHPYETGFIWHRTLSVPYLTGSSVKGLMRAWAEQWGGLTEQQEITRLFGTGEEKTENQQDQSGAIIIFDALPTKPPKLELDILNPHYAKYYEDPEHNPPADYLSPVPVFFLTVAAEQEFEFFLAPRSKQTQQDIDTGLQLLQQALEMLGAGGKTAVGYGTFKESMAAQRKREDEQSKKRQQAEDDKQEARIDQTIIVLGYRGLAAQIYRIAQQEHWETDNAKFYQSVPNYLTTISQEIDEEIKKNAITIIWEILERKSAGIMQDPDEMEGKKKNKYVHKNEKARGIAKQLLKLNA